MTSPNWSLLNKLALAAVCAFLVLNLVLFRTDRRPKIPPKVKNILLWNPMFEERDYNFGLGYLPFYENGCFVVNCALTPYSDDVDFDKYDAVVFHGPEFDPMTFNMNRTREQVFIYVSMESPLNRPAMIGSNDFFNLTMTYRLDSDVLLPYFYFKDLAGGVVSPSVNPEWKEPDREALQKHTEIHKRKSRVAAWFSSNCHSHSERELKVRELQRFTEVDVYGSCGDLRCPRSESRCFNMLKEDYYFYLSFENSLCQDYITEKAANPYKYESIPVIFSGANLTRFLPPNSYLDATRMTPYELAVKMKYLIDNPEEYAKYFWWKSYYTVSHEVVQTAPAFCKLCELLQEKWSKRYVNFASWWGGDHRKHVCS